MAERKKATRESGLFRIWLREPDLNRRPSGYEPDELPDCSIPRLWGGILQLSVALSRLYWVTARVIPVRSESLAPVSSVTLPIRWLRDASVPALW